MVKDESVPPTPEIARYEGDYEDVLELLRMSMGMVDHDAVRSLLAIEKVRGAQYLTASVNGEAVGIIGLWCDPSGATSWLEPARVIDFAVAPEHRRKGIGRALMEEAVRIVESSGQQWLWLDTGLGDERDVVYTSYGFKMVSVIPDWFGEGVHKAVYRRKLAGD